MLAQRRAVAEGIVSRGGDATTGTASGRIRLDWKAPEIIAPGPGRGDAARPALEHP